MLKRMIIGGMTLMRLRFKVGFTLWVRPKKL